MDKKINIDKIINIAEKSIMETLVNTKGKPIWLIGGKENPLRDTCIPTCFSILPELLKTHPNAKVIIGCYGDSKDSITKSEIAIVKNYVANISRINTLVHAWINLDSESKHPQILDITTPNSCRHRHLGFKVFNNSVIDVGIIDTVRNGNSTKTIQPTYVPVFERKEDTLNLYAHLIHERLRVDSQREVEAMYELITNQLSLPSKLTPTPQKRSVIERLVNVIRS